MGHHLKTAIGQVKELCRRTAEEEWERAVPQLGRQGRRRLLRNLNRTGEYGYMEHIMLVSWIEGAAFTVHHED